MSEDLAAALPATDLEAERPTFEQVYRAERVALVRVAFLMCGSTAMAEDVTQEAFLRLFQRFDAVRNARSYLRVVVTNLIRDNHRRLLRESVHREFAQSVGEPELDEVWQRLGSLPFRQRAVLVLKYYEDLPEREIAKVLGCRLGTIKSAHHRAIEKLRGELGDARDGG